MYCQHVEGYQKTRVRRREAGQGHEQILNLYLLCCDGGNSGITNEP